MKSTPPNEDLKNSSVISAPSLSKSKWRYDQDARHKRDKLQARRDSYT